MHAESGIRCSFCNHLSLVTNTLTPVSLFHSSQTNIHHTNTQSRIPTSNSPESSGVYPNLSFVCTWCTRGESLKQREQTCSHPCTHTCCSTHTCSEKSKKNNNTLRHVPQSPFVDQNSSLSPFPLQINTPVGRQTAVKCAKEALQPHTLPTHTRRHTQLMPVDVWWPLLLPY